MDETPRPTGPDLSRVLGVVPVGVVVAGPDRLVVDANPAACSLLHRSRAELVGRPLVSLFEAADAATVLDDVAARRRDAAVLRVTDGPTAPVATVSFAGGALVVTLAPDDRSARLGQALASVTAAAPVAVFAVDREGVLTLSEGEKAPIAKEHGRPPIGRPAGDVFRARWLADVFRRALEGESVAMFGEVEASWYDAIVAPYRDESGRIAGVAGLTVDVTPRARQEQAHREAEERFHALADAAFEGIAIHLDGRILCCNEAFAALGQYTPAEVVGMYAADLVTPECRPLVLDRIRHHRTEPFRATALRRDGTSFPCELRARSVPFQGRPARVVAIRDLTEQQAYEDALRRERDFNRAILDTTSALVVVLDPRGRVRLFNRRCEEVTGWKESEARDKPLWDVVLGADGEGALREHLARVVVGESPVPFVWSWRTKDGRTRWIEGATSAIDLHDGAPTVLISTGVDVTRRREAEERLRQSEESLRQAQKMEAVGRLAGGIAHDFNNLLTVIVAFADELAGLLPAGAPGHDGAEHILAAAERAAALTAQLLAFSRRHVYQPVPLDLGAAVRALEELLRRWLGDDIVLTTHLDAAGALVRGDPLQVEQVVMNLALNARDAMPRGGRLTITVRPERRAVSGGEAADYVSLVVEDTGTGMDEAVRSRMFEPFFSTKAEGKGTGLGLATVQGIVAQNRGHIEVETSPGRGTTFRVLWPRLDAAEAASRGGTEEAIGPDLGGDEVILLAEDNDLVRDATATLLRARGYRVLTARDGEDALRVADAHPGDIDLLLTDVIMPGMRGPRLADVLRQRRPGLRVLLTSAFTDDAVEIGPGRPFLQKPFTAHALARKVREVLDA